jgi:hypothetical protein
MEDAGQVKEDALEEAFRLGGWLLALQASIAAKGEIAMPLLCVIRESGDSPQLVKPRTNSDLYEEQVLAGRMFIKDQERELKIWSFVYDEDLGASGRALWLEVGERETKLFITLVQRYTLGSEDGFRLIGDLAPVGEELLPSALRERLESCSWHDRIAEGAARNELAGQRWPVWYAARFHGQIRLRIGDFSFAVPEGWVFRPTQEDGDGLVAKLLPWGARGYEPTIMARPVRRPDVQTVEDLIAEKKADLIARGLEILRAEVFDLPSPFLSSRAGRVMWDAETEGRNVRVELVWVPADGDGTFLLLLVSCFDLKSWEAVGSALEALLASLDRPARGKTAD